MTDHLTDRDLANLQYGDPTADTPHEPSPDVTDAMVFGQLFVTPQMTMPVAPPVEADDEGAGIGSFLMFLGALLVAAAFGLTILWAIAFVLFSAFGWAGLAFLAGLLVATWAATRAARRGGAR